MRPWPPSSTTGRLPLQRGRVGGTLDPGSEIRALWILTPKPPHLDTRPWAGSPPSICHRCWHWMADWEAEAVQAFRRWSSSFSPVSPHSSSNLRHFCQWACCNSEWCQRTAAQSNSHPVSILISPKDTSGESVTEITLNSHHQEFQRMGLFSVCFFFFFLKPRDCQGKKCSLQYDGYWYIHINEISFIKCLYDMWCSRHFLT